MEEKKYIKGNFKRSIFSSEKGYVIGVFKIKETNIETLNIYIGKTITFTGYFHELNEDDTYFFYGEESEHPKYGLQFQVTEYEKVKPEDKDGIVEFLASDLFKGIGEKLALTIVETLGEQTLDRILEDPTCLTLVPKLSDKKATQIYETLTKYEESHKTIVYLTELGFSMKDALLIYNKYKGNTIPMVEHNVYLLIDDIEEITFSKVDDIAHKLNMLEDDESRVKACILYCMKELSFRNGDTYLEEREIYQTTLNFLRIDLEENLFLEYLNELVIEEKLVKEEDFYYLKDMYDSEQQILKKFQILNRKPDDCYKKLEEKLQELEEASGIVYNEKQKEAIRKALTKNLLIITGGPGTGKTTIIKAIVELYKRLRNLDDDSLNKELALLAPTGRASKRMSEATLFPATTIHRFLKWNKENNRFGIDEYNKDNSRLIIIDEVSMIDLSLFDHLLKGLTDHIKLILVGDYNQLPSVGPGELLKDFTLSGVIETVHLDLLYRQDENSYITTLAGEIKDNDVSNTFRETRSDYTFLECSSNYIRENLKHLCKRITEKGYDYKRVQVMAPMYAGVNGIDNLNKELQDVFNPKDESKREIKVGDIIFRENDKVLELVNMPEENIFNGDIGIITRIMYANTSKSGKNEIYVDYDGNVVKYIPKDFNKIKHGFIISIHKSQGSEFEIVVMPVSSSYKRMLYRKLIYTGVTRAKRKLILLGEPDAFLYSVAHEAERERKSNLCKKLKETLHKIEETGEDNIV